MGGQGASTWSQSFTFCDLLPWDLFLYQKNEWLSQNSLKDDQNPGPVPPPGISSAFQIEAPSPILQDLPSLVAAHRP